MRKANPGDDKGNYLGKTDLDLCADVNGAPLHAHRRAGLGAAGRHPRGGGEFRPVGRRVFYCELCSADGSSPWS